MGGRNKCCVKFCNNSSQKGYRLFSLPSKVTKAYQRNLWLQSGGLQEEDMPKDARFCEGHFTMDNFERLNYQGLMGLKSNGVPTLFGFCLPKTVSASPEPEPELETKREISLVDENTVPEIRSPAQRNQADRTEEELCPVMKRAKSYSDRQHLSQLDLLKMELDEAVRKREMYRKTAATWKKKCRFLSQNLKTFLNDDQIAVLELDNPAKNNAEWSDETIKLAQEIRLTLKSKGYDFLRTKLKYPLPAPRILQKRLQNLDIAPGPHNETVQDIPAVVIDLE